MIFQSDSFGHNRLLISVFLGDVIEPFLEPFHFQKFVPVPEIDLKLFDVVHSFEKGPNHGLYFSMELFDFDREKGLFDILTVFEVRDSSCKFFVICLSPLQLLGVLNGIIF